MAKKRKVKVAEPGTKEAEEVLKWRSLIDLSERKREKAADEFRWRDFLEEFKGNFKIGDFAVDPNISIPPINLVYAYLKTEIPSLYLRDPHFEVNPKNGSSVLSAKIREIAINYIWRHKRMKRETKKNIWDAKLVGHSWFKTGYTGRFGTIEDGNGHLMEYIESEDFFGYRVPWNHITYNLESTDPPVDSRWVAHEIWRPLEDVKKNERYQNTESLNPTPVTTANDLTKNDLEKRSETLWVRMWEVWDIVNQQVFTLAEGLDTYLEPPKKWPYKMRGYPFTRLAFNPINDESYPVPDVFMFEPQILELIKIRAQQLDHIKRFNRILETEKGNLDEEAKTNLSLGLTGSVIEANQIGKINPVAYPAIQTDIYAVEERVKEDMINVSGQSPLERGGTQKTTTRTIGELLQIQRGAQNRRSEQVDIVEDFLEDCARNIISLLMQFADAPFYVKLTGREPQQLLQELALRPSAQDPNAITTTEGFTFTKEDIQGEYDVDIKVGSTIPLDRENKINLMLQVMELAPKMGAIPGGPVNASLAKMIGEELDMPELLQAIQEELLVQQQRQAQAQQQAEQQQQIQAAQFGLEKQLEADKIAAKQTGDLIKLRTATVNAQGGQNGQGG